MDTSPQSQQELTHVTENKTANVIPHYKKTFLLAGVLLVIIILAAALKFFYPIYLESNQPTGVTFNNLSLSPTASQDETANWNTLTNIQYHYSFKYPQGYSKDFHFDDNNFSNELSSDTWPPSKLHGIVDFSIGYDLPPDQTKGTDTDKSCYQDLIEELSVGSKMTIVPTVGNIDNKIAPGVIDWSIDPKSGAGVYYEYPISVNSRCFSFRFQSVDDPKNQDADKVFVNQVLSTFKLLNLPSDTTNWKLFNKIDGVTFKYPSSGWNVDDNTTKQTTITKARFTNLSFVDPNCKGDCDTFSITVAVEQNPNNLSVDDFLKKTYGASYSNYKLSDFNSKTGEYFVKVTGPLGTTLFSLYSKHGNKIYSFSPSAGVNGTTDDQNDPKIMESLNIFYLILSTVTFADQK